MTKKSPDMFAAYLTALGDVMMIKKAAARVGISEDRPRVWEVTSRRDEAEKVTGSVFYFEYAGVLDWFHRHTRRAISRSIEDIEASARDRALNGTYTVAQHRGETVYRKDPALIGKPWLVEMLGLPDDLLRDPVTGMPQPELVWTPPATDLVLGVLAAHSARYKRQSKIDIDMNARIAGGVMLAASPSPKTFSSQPAPVQVIEAPNKADPEIIEEAEAVEIASDVTLTEPVKDEPEPVVAPVQAPEERTIREAPPAEWKPTASRGLTALERDLLDRLKNPATRSLNPPGGNRSVLSTTTRPGDE